MEAAEAAIDWAFGATPADRISSVDHDLNLPSQKVAQKLGEQPSGARFAPFGEPCEVWEIAREAWRRRSIGQGAGPHPRA